MCSFYLRTFLAASLLLIFHCRVNAHENHNDTSNKYAIKIDVAADYYTFFDHRNQARLGLELEQKINSNSFVSYSIDAGLFDKYHFIKYYDFFNQQQGMYSINQRIQIEGLHLMPGYNTFLFQSSRKKQQGIYFGGSLDFSLYHKQMTSFNSQTLIQTSLNYLQFKTGLGLSGGIKYQLFRRIFVEARTNLLTKIWHLKSNKHHVEIPVLHAQWTSPDNQFWWISNLKIGYEF